MSVESLPFVGKNARVVLVDDDEAILRLLQKKLERAGYCVDAYTDSKQAFQAIRETPPEFVITDWEMPELDGLQLCRQIRALEQSTYVYSIILTSRTGKEELVSGFEAGADDFVSKDRLQIDEIVARLVAGRRIVELERRLRHMAKTDVLTGLLNRRSFMEIVTQEWRRATRYQLPVSFAMLDVDYFKRINDSHGHVIGDAVLRQIADTLREACRTTERIGRYGGEEFCVMLPETDRQGAIAWSERLRAKIEGETIRIGNVSLKITVSVGLSHKQDGRQTVDVLLDQADQALLAAKEAGRNRVICFDSLGSEASTDALSSSVLGTVFAGVTVGDIVKPSKCVLSADRTLVNTVDELISSHVGLAPVVDKEEHLVGCVTEKEVLGVVPGEDALDRSLGELDLVRPNLIWYEADAPLRNVYDFFVRVSIDCVFVLRNGRLAGQVSRSDLLAWVRDRLVAMAIAPRHWSDGSR